MQHCGLLNVGRCQDVFVGIQNVIEEQIGLRRYQGVMLLLWLLIVVSCSSCQGGNLAQDVDELVGSIKPVRFRQLDEPNVLVFFALERHIQEAHVGR